MTAALEGLAVRAGSEIRLAGTSFALLELEDGTQLIGEEPTAREHETFDWLAAEKGLSKRHVKVLIDAVGRYQYPHMAIGYARMRWPKSDRKFFHPQHRNLATEEASFDEAVRADLARIFRPQKGWIVFDIGAYLGHGALWVAREVGRDGKVLCVEAKKQNVAVIEEHARRNDLPQIQTRCNAIWREAGVEVEFHTTERQANAIDAEVVDGETISVSTTSLPALIEDVGAAPQLVSLTVNGAEVEAIEGLACVPSERLPERIMAPGWYKKDGEPRCKLIAPRLESLGYRVAVTSGGFVFGWRV